MSDISTFYGGSILAMVGKNCVSIINDYRLGNGFMTVSKDFQKIHMITPKIYIGLPTFVPDCQFLLKKIKKHVALFKLDEGREIEPRELASLMSYILYSKRDSELYTDPLVIGLDSKNEPYLCGLDCLGCKSEPGTFVAGGTAQINLIGMCEALYCKDMEEEDLFVTSVQVFLNSVDRDALSGWGAECVVISRDRRVTRRVRGRCD